MSIGYYVHSSACDSLRTSGVSERMLYVKNSVYTDVYDYIYTEIRLPVYSVLYVAILSTAHILFDEFEY